MEGTIKIIKNIFLISSFIVTLTFVNRIISNKTSDETKTIKFQQPSESTPAKHILVHIPTKEIFMSTLHPAAALYEDVTDEVKVEECFKNLEKILKQQNIELIKVRSALKLNRTALLALAADSLT